MPSRQSPPIKPKQKCRQRLFTERGNIDEQSEQILPGLKLNGETRTVQKVHSDDRQVLDRTSAESGTVAFPGI